MNRLDPTPPSSKICHIGALILHAQNENIDSLSEEDRPL
jgi:hypothetical protein